jgi:hypothetical protein
MIYRMAAHDTAWFALKTRETWSISSS